MAGYNGWSAETIRKWDNEQEQQIALGVYLPGSENDRSFEKLAQSLENLTAHLKFVRKETLPGKSELSGYPAVLLNNNIVYAALPYDRELSPFLEACTWQIDPPALSDSVQDLLDRVNFSVSLRLYIAQACPHCPEVVRTVVPMALQSGDIHLEIIDGTLFPDLAREDSVMSAPCLILDNDFRWTGMVPAEEICRMILDRDPSQLSAASLKEILSQGGASWIAGQMIRQDKIFDGFMGLIFHDIWSVRLGAVVVAEEMAEKKPELASRLCPPLLEKLKESGLDISLKGDIFYTLGVAGGPGTAAAIKELLKGIENEELAEAAEEAIDAIESRYPA